MHSKLKRISGNWRILSKVDICWYIVEEKDSRYRNINLIVTRWINLLPKINLIIATYQSYLFWDTQK